MEEGKKICIEYVITSILMDSNYVRRAKVWDDPAGAKCFTDSSCVLMLNCDVTPPPPFFFRWRSYREAELVHG